MLASKYLFQSLICILFMLAEAHRADAHQDTQTEFINAIPDFTQTDIAGARHGNGYEYCGPAAVANSLFWLNGNKGDIERLVIKLASKRYMHTDVRQGTHTANILHGVDVMARDMFGGYRRLVYQGWRPHARRFSSGKRIPDYDDLVSNISDHSAVWLNVGWYRYDERDDVYHRVGGHWVTLVGYDKDTFVLHDPSPRAGNSFANEFVQTSLINSGMMVGDSTGLPVPARGYIRLGEGMHIKRNADTAIVDGAVIFNL